MSTIKSTLVITSIANDRHPVLRQYAEQCQRRNIAFILIGDKKSPPQFNISGCEFWDLEKQHRSSFAHISKMIPTGHYARKNIGYLAAMAKGADLIIETDDDNIPYKSFWKILPMQQHVKVTADKGQWVNMYRHFTKQRIWPRGYPLHEIAKPLSENFIERTVLCPIQQGLINANTDVDAIYRLTEPAGKITFHRRKPIALGHNNWCPFNSQNTRWYKKSFPLLYLPSYCSFRMTDIWRSFVAMRIANANDWHVLFHAPTVYQKRNAHDLMKDFEDEIPGYLNNQKIRDCLEGANIKGGEDNIQTDLFNAYKKLVKESYMDKKELPIVEKWIKYFDK